MHEWALLIFTVCMQTAIGGIFMLSLFYNRLSKNGAELTFKAMKWPLLVIAALSIVGLGASFAHLGTPSNAFNTLLNIGSSWMSREILVTGLFIAAACMTAGLSFVQKKVNPWLLWISSLIGIVDIYCMSALYSQSLISGWSSINTFTSFYGTALVVGPVLAIVFLLPALKGEEELFQHFVKYAFFIAMIGIAVQLIGTAFFATTLPEINIIEGTGAMALLENYQGTVLARWLIELLGVGLIGYITLAGKRNVSLSAAYAALAALLVAEGMSRYVFYVLGA